KLAVHHVWVGKALEAFYAELDAVAGVLGTAEWDAWVHVAVGIDPGGTGFELRCDLEGALAVSGPDGRAKSHVECVGHLDGFIDSRVLNNRQGWAELFLSNQWVVVVDISNQGSREEVSRLVVVRLTTDEHACTAVLSSLDQLVDDIELLLILQRPQHVLFFQAHAHRHVLGYLNERVHDLVIDGLWNVQTLHRGTGLTSVNECAPEMALGDFLSVDIVKHNARVVAAELQGHASQGSCGGFHNLAAGLSGADGHELVDVLAGRQSRADLAITGDDVENTFWKNTVNDLHQCQYGQWGVLT